MAFYDTFHVPNWSSPVVFVPARHAAGTPAMAAGRLAWADLAKGMGILLVVLMHSTLGVGEALHATGWTHHVVAFAKPFRMPDFFLIAGIFASAALALPFRSFFDKRVLHFAYFYALWVTLTVLVKGIAENGLAPGVLLHSLVEASYEPFSALWFIYILPLMALTLRAVHRLPVLPVLAGATALHILAMHHADGGVYALSTDLTGSFALDSYSLFVVFFLIGHAARPWLLAIAEAARRNPLPAVVALLGWASLNAIIVQRGWTDHPFAALPAGLAGAMAVIVLAAVLTRVPLFGWLARLGRQSLTIYLAFTIPMAVTRIVLIKSGVITDVGWISALTFAVALAAPLVLAALVKATPLAFLYRRPGWARLA